MQKCKSKAQSADNDEIEAASTVAVAMKHCGRGCKKQMRI
jgi:hypothetical protein